MASTARNIVQPLTPMPSVSTNRSRPSVSVVATRPVFGDSSIREHAALLLGLAFVCLSLVGLLIYLLVDSARPTGTVVVTSIPTTQVDVFLDDKLVGSQTPLNLEKIPLGQHTISARATGYKTRPYQFVLEGGADAIVPIVLRRIAVQKKKKTIDLIVASDPPGATIKINGAEVGETPCTIQNLDPNRVMILELSKNGFESVTQVLRLSRQDIKTGSKGLNFILKKRIVARPPPASLAVNSTPPGAAVFLDGKKLGQTPLSINKLVTNKAYTVTLSKPGFARVSKEIQATAGGNRLSVPLTRNTERKDEKRGKKRPKKTAAKKKCTGGDAKIAVSAFGSRGCNVTVGGQALGEAPFFGKPSPSGSCNIEVICADGKRFSQTRQIKAGTLSKVIITGSMWE